MYLRYGILASVIAASTTAFGQQAQVSPPPPTSVAGIPVNYDEANVGNYTLPDPLQLKDGTKVQDLNVWAKRRRPEIVSLFETEQYGKAPGRPPKEHFEIVEKEAPALNGKALRRQVTLSFSEDPTWPKMHLLIYLPVHRQKPAPVLLSISFVSPSNAVDDPGILPGEEWDPKTNKRVPARKGRGFGQLNVLPFLEAGIGVATFYYGDIDPDSPNGFTDGIRAHYLTSGQKERKPEEWGSIAAWAWGLSRAQDYFETDRQIDAKRVAIHGVSRLGKTALWAGAHDQRFAAVIASCSGEGGAALSHRNYGETIAHLTASGRYPYQFAQNYAKWAGFPDKAPMDSNLLIALVAPRPLLLQTGSTDGWSDPKGEFLAAIAAEPVYKLYGKRGLDTNEQPKAGEPILHDLSYYMHEGGHGMVPADWNIYLEFLKMHLHPEK